MSRAPGRGAFASRPLAVLVAGIQCAAGSAGDHANRSADVDQHGARTEHDPRDISVAPKALYGRGRDRRRELHVGGWGSRQSLQGFEGRGDLEMWALARVLRHEPGIERMKRQFDERIALATIKGAIVALAHRLRERLEGRPQPPPPDRVGLAPDEYQAGFPNPDTEAQ